MDAMVGLYPGEILFRVSNPQGAMLFDRDGSTPLGTGSIPYGTQIGGTPRGDGYIVEVAQKPFIGWVHALDLVQLGSAPPSPVLASGYFAGLIAPAPPPGSGGPPPCPDGWDQNPETGTCEPVVPWPIQQGPIQTGFDIPLWSPLVSPVTAPALAAQETGKLAKSARDLFGGGSGSGGAPPKEPGFDWSGVLKIAAITGLVVGGFWAYEMWQTQKATSMGVLRGALGGGGGRR